MTILTRLSAALCATALATGAVAQDRTQVDPATIDLGQRMAMGYANLSNEFFKDLLAPEQVLRLFILTKQQIVAAVCDGYTLDEDRLSTRLNAVLRTQPMLDGEPNALFLGRIMHGYGIIKGGEMALAIFDPDAYCAYGGQFIEEMSGGDPEELLVLRAAE
jgi:hypothetical protein